MLALSATALPCAALSLAKIPASAAAVSDTLLSPLSYEEYLSLDEPADVAVTDGYTAIADGNRLHVFNRAKNEYRTLSMPSGTITKIQFDDNDNLYVLDSLMDFHRVDLATEEISHVSALQCTAFFINGNDCGNHMPNSNVN